MGGKRGVGGDGGDGLSPNCSQVSCVVEEIGFERLGFWAGFKELTEKKVRKKICLKKEKQGAVF